MKKRASKIIFIIGAAALLLPAIVLAAVVGRIFYSDAKDAIALSAQADIILEHPGKNAFEMNGQTYIWLPQKGYFLLAGEDRGKPVAIIQQESIRGPVLEGLYRLPNERYELYEFYHRWAVFCPVDQAEEIEAFYKDNANYDMRNVQCELNYGQAYAKSLALKEGIFEELLQLRLGSQEYPNDVDVTEKDCFRLTATSLDGTADKRVMLYHAKRQFYNGTGRYSMALPEELNTYLVAILLDQRR